jgi:hypothetical protein
MTPREEFHRFLDEQDDELVTLARPSFHRAIDELEEDWVPAALARMRKLRVGLPTASGRIDPYDAATPPRLSAASQISNQGPFGG